MNKIKLFWTNLQASLWFLPGIMLIITIALALALIEIDSNVKTEWLIKYPRLFGLGADGSRGMLSAIAGSMLTVATLAFSLTLNAITQASGQYTPRIFRNFMRDRSNQFVLGYFVSVFAYCLIVLRTIRGGDELKFVPSISVMVGLVFALGGVLVLIYFIHHIADSLQITTILDNITDETRKAVEKLFPQELGESATGDEKDAAWNAAKMKDWAKVPALNSGYVQNVDTDGLLEFAVENKVLIQMRRGIGQYAGTGATLAAIAPDNETAHLKINLDDEKIKRVNSFFSINRHRTIEQDVGFGIRQIVDIALKALSPGINDTTTAVNCVDHLGEIVGQIARRQIPTRVRTKDGVPRVIVDAPDFHNYVETAFDQIRVSGKANQAIFERLLETLAYIGECATEVSRRVVIRRQIDLVGAAADKTLETEYEKEKVRKKLSEAQKSV